MNNKKLADQDSQIWDLIKQETDRQSNELELIASENYASPAVLEAMATPLNNKYSEGYSGKRYYGGNQVIDRVEDLAIDRAKALFGAEHVNVQPLSGTPANLAVYLALLEPGDKIMGLKLDHGGHLSHGHPVSFSGKLFDFTQYELNPKTNRLDLDLVREKAQAEKPRMLLAGFSAYSREIDWSGIKEIADEIGAFTVADISHPAGLIAGGQLINPVPIFDVVMTTTHKTLRGPRGAMIMCKKNLAKDIDRAVFPGMQGGPHEHIIAAKAAAFKEALTDEFKVYAGQVIKNAKAMAQTFIDKGYEVLTGGTDTHLFVLDLQNKNIDGKTVEQIMERAGMSASRSTVPNDPNPPMKPSGLRLGTAAITTRGFKEEDCVQVANIIHELISNKGADNIINEAKAEVKKLCGKHPLPYEIN